MAKELEHEVAYYYDLYPTTEDLMGETSDHSMLVRYLMEVLTYFFEGHAWCKPSSLPSYAGHIRKKGHTGQRNASGTAGYSLRSKP